MGRRRFIAVAPQTAITIVNADASAVDTITPTPHGSPTGISQRASTSESQGDPQKNGNNTYDYAEADHRDQQRLFPARFDGDLPLCWEVQTGRRRTLAACLQPAYVNSLAALFALVGSQ
jgi:hypothetical protein